LAAAESRFAEERVAENFLHASSDGRWVMDLVQKGDGGEWQIFVRRQEGDGGWRMIADLGDECIRAVFGDRWLFVLSLRGAPRGQVLRLELDDEATVADATVVVPPGELAIEEIAATDARLWVVDVDGGPSRIRAFDHDGNALPEVPLPAVSSVGRPLELGRSAVAWAVETFVSPRAWWVHADDAAEPRRTALDTVTPIDFAGIEVERVFAASKDGTRIPINLICRRAHRRTPPPRRCSTPTAASRSRSNRRLSRRGCCGSSRAACTRSRTFAAAASTAANGTMPGASRSNRIASTTSPPAPTTSWTRA
jgi:prolyl oligopeptidase